jgi:hypothetical protein
MGAVALCALILWAGVSIRDHLAGYQPLRAIRTGNAIKRRTAARDLTEPGRKINTEEAMAALIPTLGVEDAGVRASAAESLGVVIYFSRDHTPTVPVASDLLARRIEVATRTCSLIIRQGSRCPCGRRDRPGNDGETAECGAAGTRAARGA